MLSFVIIPFLAKKFRLEQKSDKTKVTNGLHDKPISILVEMDYILYFSKISCKIEYLPRRV
jgi:hypothetical protein